MKFVVICVVTLSLLFPVFALLYSMYHFITACSINVCLDPMKMKYKISRDFIETE